MWFSIEKKKISDEEEDNINKWLYEWYKRNIESITVYHGSSAFYADYIKKNGLNPSDHPYKKRLNLIFYIFKRIIRIYPKLIDDYIKFNNSYTKDWKERTYWTPDKKIAVEVFTKRNKGGELLRVINESINNILLNEDKKFLLDKLLSKREKKFLINFKKWIERVRKYNGILLKTKLSNPAFNYSCVFALDSNYARPAGDYNHFKKELKKFLKKSGWKWDYESVKKYFSFVKMRGYDFEDVGIPADKIEVQDIEIEYF